jgi:hypothetical protein
MFTPRTNWDPHFAERLPRHFAPLVDRAEPFASLPEWPPIELWNRLLPADLRRANALGTPIRFEVQTARPASRRRREPLARDSLYEASVYTRGVVPSRPESWHDFFNMLVWAAFPRSRRALNARHYRCLERWVPERFDRLPNARLREQDALSMLDEGSVLLVCTAASTRTVNDVIARGDHPALHALIREGAARALIFGHALYEHLVSSDAVVRAAPVVLPTEAPLTHTPTALRDLADELFAQALEDARNFTEPSAAPAVPLVTELFTRADDARCNIPITAMNHPSTSPSSR